MKLRYSIILIAIFLTGCCHYGEYHISVFNNSGKNIYCRTFVGSNPENGFNYLLKRNHQYDIGVGLGKDDSDLLDKSPNDKIINVIYFDSINWVGPNDKIEKIEQKQGYILKKYSKKDMANSNWTIEYP